MLIRYFVGFLGISVCTRAITIRHMSSYFAFLVAAAILALTPGPGIAYVVARTAAAGRAEGLASCIGTAFGGFLHVGAAALGLSVLLVQSAFAFSVVKYIGAAYLIFLGLRLLLFKSPMGDAPGDAPSDAPGDAPSDAPSHALAVSALGVRRAVRDGILVEAFNVKTAMFFLAFLPQFLVPGPAVVLQLVVMGTVCVALNTLVDVLAVLGANRLLQAGLARRRRERLLTQLSGVTMVGLGLYVAVSRRGA